MSYKRPSRHEVVDKQFPVRLTLAVDPAHHDLVRRALERTAGAGNYGTTPLRVWSAQKVHGVHLYNLWDAMTFLAACPQARLWGERYEGPWR
jgi:hypothetical protein